MDSETGALVLKKGMARKQIKGSAKKDYSKAKIYSTYSTYGNPLVMNGGHTLSLQGLFFAQRKKAAYLNPFVKEPLIKPARADGEGFFVTTRRDFAGITVFISGNHPGPPGEPLRWVRRGKGGAAK